MPLDRSYTYFERMTLHRRFYIPATICLFLSCPGGLASLLPSGNVLLSSEQRIETLLFYLPLLISYTLLLILALPRPSKVALGFLGFPLGLLLTILLLRTTIFTVNFHWAILRLDVILRFFPIYLMFIVLCILDQKKRDRSVLWGLVILTIPLSIYSAMTKESVKFFDYLRLHDVAERLEHKEARNEYMTEQCDLISEIALRENCHKLLIQSTAESTLETMYCDESDGVTDCALSRRQHIERTLSAHPPSAMPRSLDAQ